MALTTMAAVASIMEHASHARIVRLASIPWNAREQIRDHVLRARIAPQEIIVPTARALILASALHAFATTQVLRTPAGVKERMGLGFATIAHRAAQATMRPRVAAARMIQLACRVLASM